MSGTHAPSTKDHRKVRTIDGPAFIKVVVWIRTSPVAENGCEIGPTDHAVAIDITGTWWRATFVGDDEGRRQRADVVDLKP